MDIIPSKKHEDFLSRHDETSKISTSVLTFRDILMSPLLISTVMQLLLPSILMVIWKHYPEPICSEVYIIISFLITVYRLIIVYVNNLVYFGL